MLGTVVCDALMRHCLSDEFEVQHECKLQCPHTFIEAHETTVLHLLYVLQYRHNFIEAALPREGLRLSCRFQPSGDRSADFELLLPARSAALSIVGRRPRTAFPREIGLPAGDVIVLHDGNGRHAYHALTLAMVALDALATDQSSRALGCAQGARYGCPKAAASSLEQIVSIKAPFFTRPKDLSPGYFRAISGLKNRRESLHA